MKILKARKKVLWLVFFLLVMLDIFLFKKTDDLATLALLAFWIILVFVYKPRTTVVLLISFIALVLSPLLQLLGKVEMLAKASGWSYIFLITGLVDSYLSKRIRVR